MMNTLKSWFRRLTPDAAAHMATPQHQSMRFQLCLHQLEVGTLLLLDGGTWRFEYAEAFRRQQHIKPLVGFPDVAKVYLSDHLWPFFASRIPTPDQPYVRERAQHKQLDLNNPAEMLREFGQRTITNPYALQELVEA
ncbi:HipA N-terminal domain-containing protein [Hymenobacter sp.]|uniref:HipA N-terminal domain-containing protein n=1 Tax=Hymenobacter sp. TaxID=1898978 RepID=UPI00286CA222|nr:HipA N-terminal domain-containing protein [Hymenobacter sp.]